MKADFLILYPDQTHKIKRVSVIGDRVKGFKNWNPKIIAGKSVFPERDPGRLQLWQRFKRWGKRRKRFIIGVYGGEFCYTLTEDLGKIDEHWSIEEAEQLINKIIAWAAARAKIFSKFEIYVFWILLIISIILNVLIIRRVGI